MDGLDWIKDEELPILPYIGKRFKLITDDGQDSGRRYQILEYYFDDKYNKDFYIKSILLNPRTLKPETKKFGLVQGQIFHTPIRRAMELINNGNWVFLDTINESQDDFDWVRDVGVSTIDLITNVLEGTNFYTEIIDDDVLEINWGGDEMALEGTYVDYYIEDIESGKISYSDILGEIHYACENCSTCPEGVRENYCKLYQILKKYDANNINESQDDFDWAKGDVYFTIDDIIGKQMYYRKNNLSDLENKGISLTDLNRGDVELGDIRWYDGWVVEKVLEDNMCLLLVESGS